jgi:NADH dehydrogenase
MNITIVGGGFGGVKTALELARHAENQITLISNKPDFQYYPALYGAATGHNHLESWVPLKEIFDDKKNVHIVIDAIKSINPETKQLTSESSTIMINVFLRLGASRHSLASKGWTNLLMELNLQKR